MSMKIWKSRVLKTIAGLVSIFVLYGGAVGYYLWKWETPHHPLRVSVFEQQDQHIHPDADTDLAIAINQAMITLAEELQSVSISGAIAINGSVTWAGAVGLAKVEDETPATTNSRYRIGSVSKSLTAIALARMVDLGMIDLDAEVQQYMPDYPRYEMPMTVRQLAGHMAGVRHYAVDLTMFPPHDSFSNAHFDDVLAATSFFKYDPLQFLPGLGFSYSTYGYTLLSAVMQEAAGKPFLQLMAELVFEPLNMSATGPEDRSDELRGIVSFYNSDDGLYGATRPVDLSIKWAGGGLISTPTDLVTLGASLLNDQLISQDTRDQFFMPQAMFDGSENPQAYALGWRHHKTIHILGEESPVDVVHHGGTSVGGVAFLLLVPEHNISVAFLSNGVGENTRNDLQLLAYRVAAMAIK
jgi:serine beta-lactamase-like protein LACTB